MSKEKKIAIIIPAFNEEASIKEVIESIPQGFDGVNERVIIVVDDGSTDQTARIAESTSVVVERHMTNKGVGSALMTGINKALSLGANVAVNIDADGQFEAKEISKLIEPIIKNQADFVSGNRFSKGQPENMPRLKYFGNRMMSGLISSLIGGKYADVSCGFRAYSLEAMFNLNIFGRYTYTQESFLDLANKNLAIKEVPIAVQYFKDRKSKIANNLFKYGYKTLGIIFRAIVHYKLFKILFFPGLLSVFTGTGFTLFMFWNKINTGAYTPYKAFGFIGAALIIFGFLLLIVGLFANTFERIRINQERILYYEKRRYFDKKS